MPSLPPAPFLYPIVDTALLGDRPLAACMEALLRGGARILQLRAKGLEDAERLRLARGALAVARTGGVPLLINDRADIARIVGADGVHLGQTDLPPSDARSLLGRSAIIGLSTHTLAQVEAAAAEPVDYLAFGPVFATPTKSDPDPTVGLDLLRLARSLTERPLVAIGGITQKNAASVLDAGADGLAAISALLSAADAEAAALEFARVIGAARG